MKVKAEQVRCGPARWRMAVAAAAAGALLLPATSSAATARPSARAPQKLTVALSAAGAGASFMNVYLTHELGYDKAVGIDSKVTTAGVAFTSLIATGQADIAMTSPSGAVSSANEGLATSVVYGTQSATASAYVVGLPDVKDPESCQNMVTLPQGYSSYGITLAMKKFFKADWNLITVDSPAAITATVLSGRADCAMAVAELFLPSIRAGKLKVLFTPKTRKHIKAIPAGVRNQLSQVLWGTTSRLKKKKSLIQRYITAFDKCYREVTTKKSPQEIAALLLKDPAFAGRQESDLALTVQAYQGGMNWPDHGFITASAWNTTLRALRDSGFGFINPKSSKFSYKSRVDMSFYKKALKANVKKKAKKKHSSKHSSKKSTKK
jgi:hypothetical protein